MSSNQCSCLCIVRLLYAIMLIFGLLCYIYQLHDDQQISFGSTIDNLGKITQKNTKLENKESIQLFGGQNNETKNSDTKEGKSLQHRGNTVYVFGFLAILLFSLLGLVALCFESRMLLLITLPLYILLVVLNFLYIGRKWLKVDYISGYCTVASGTIASLLGIIYLCLLFIRGPEDSASGNQGSFLAKVVNFKNRAPPSDQVKAALQRKRTVKKSQK